MYPPDARGHPLDLVCAYISKGWTLAVGQHGHAPNISYTLSNYTLFYPDRCEGLAMLGSYLPIRWRTVFAFDKLPIRSRDTVRDRYRAYISIYPSQLPRSIGCDSRLSCTTEREREEKKRKEEGRILHFNYTNQNYQFVIFRRNLLDSRRRVFWKF